MNPSTILLIVGVGFSMAVLASCFVSVQQGTIAVITVFGKYSRIMGPGLNFKIPLIEVVYKKISTQNRSLELEFQATTIDQANVYFKAMLLFSVLDQKEKEIVIMAMEEKKFHAGDWVIK